MVNMKVTEGGRRGSQLSKSKEMTLVLEGSMPLIANNRPFSLCRTTLQDLQRKHGTRGLGKVFDNAIMLSSLDIEVVCSLTKCHLGRV